jgi:hypothetical protein
LVLQSLKIKKSKDSRRYNFPDLVLVAHQPEFLPWLGFISKASMGDAFFILDTVQFRKEGAANRNKIRIKNEQGWQWLTIPVEYAKSKIMNLSEVNISKTDDWKKKHLQSLKFSYGKSPYFKQIFDEIENIYNSSSDEKLIDFVIKFIMYSFDKFKINIPIYRTSELQKEGYDIGGSKTDLILNLCKTMDARLFVFGQHGKKYIEKEKFHEKKIEFTFQNFRHPKYNQIHGEFLPEMSCIDLLFNYGDKAYDVLYSKNLN